MSDEAARTRWNARYGGAGPRGDPARVLTDYAHLLPAAGTALDLACGLGSNALYLAARGLEVAAWDIAATAIERLRADAGNLPVHAAVRDVTAAPPPPGAFDVVVVARYLDRELCSAIAASLRPGGLLYYQTFVRDKAGDRGPSNPDFLLADNELLRLFADLRVRAYREEGRLGDTSRGFRDEAMLVAQRMD